MVLGEEIVVRLTRSDKSELLNLLTQAFADYEEL
jgi:hypothetical protein